MNPNEIKTALVVGAGTMGHSIAQVYAQKGIQVNLVDLNKKQLDYALDLIKSNLSTLAEFGRVKNNEIPEIVDRIHLTTDLAKAAEEANIVIEAVNELADLKKKVFSQLEEYCPEDTILASNTSGLNIFEIAELKTPERLIIHHYFAPPHIIPLVEIVPGPKTRTDIIDFSVNLMKFLGKRPVILKEYVTNFIVNRIQGVLQVQAYEMLQKGWATAEDIDLAIKTSLGIRLPYVGIVQSLDFTGLDLILDKQKEFRLNKRYPQVEDMVSNGHLGVKTGKGFYDYGNRSEAEILKKRDQFYLKILNLLEENDFNPI